LSQRQQDMLSVSCPLKVALYEEHHPPPAEREDKPPLPLPLSPPPPTRHAQRVSTPPMCF